jgi:hypothetical protein
VECLLKAGYPAATALSADTRADGPWRVLRAGARRVTTLATEAGTAPGPVASAVLAVLTTEEA